MSQDIFDDIHKDCQLSIFLLEKQNDLLTKKLAVEALNKIDTECSRHNTRAWTITLNALEQIEWVK